MQTITLLGKSYKVRCPAGKEAELQHTAEVLSERLQETKGKSGLTTREDIIMMTALNMCHEELHKTQSTDTSDNATI